MSSNTKVNSNNNKNRIPIIPNEFLNNIKGIANISFALCPRCSTNRNNIVYQKLLKNQDGSSVHQIKCNNCSNTHYICEKCSWKRKTIFDSLYKLKRHQKSNIHKININETNIFCTLVFDSVDLVDDENELIQKMIVENYEFNLPLISVEECIRYKKTIL